MLFARIAARIAAISVLAILPLWPVTLQQLTTAQMTGVSSAIVRGKVSGSYTALSGRTIFTHYTVQVSEIWKGSAAPAPGSATPTVDVAIPGGKLNGLRQTFAGVPQLQTGHEYVLFLWTGSSGPTQLAGLTQGALEVHPDSTGQVVVSRQATGEIMLNSLGRPINDQPVRMPLTDLHTRVNAAMAGAPAQ